MNVEQKSTFSKWKAVLVIAAALLAGGWLLWTGPTTAPVEKVRPPKVVQTIEVRPSSHPIAVSAYGTVIPARRVTVEPEVSGLIVSQHPELIPGGVIQEGELLFEIDSTLVRLGVEESEAAVARAEAQLKEAERQRNQTRQLTREQVVPESELEAIESTVEIQKADLRRLKASLERSKELLKRHRVRAPFNALVVDELVEVGQRVDSGFEAATLVGADEFWIKASLPVDKLKWLDAVGNDGETEGADADVYLATGGGESSHRAGQVVRLLGDVDRVGRMARVLVKILDPLGLKSDVDQEPFLLNSYVRVEIDAGMLENVLAIDRIALRENDRIWVVGPENELRIRDVHIRWVSEETVYIDNVIGSDEALVVSSLRVALPGMKVKPEPAPAQSGPSVSLTLRQ